MLVDWRENSRYNNSIDAEFIDSVALLDYLCLDNRGFF
jgi:hypothetical protein